MDLLVNLYSRRLAEPGQQVGDVPALIRVALREQHLIKDGLRIRSAPEDNR